MKKLKIKTKKKLKQDKKLKRLLFLYLKIKKFLV